jgi:hypothetical protein
VVRALAALFAAIAVALMVAAIIAAITGRPAARAGGAMRAVAVLCFGVAVVLNIIAH